MTAQDRRAAAPSMEAPVGPYRFHLFLAGDEPNSRRARENLKRICSEHISTECELQITDVLQDFQVALERGIYITPALLVEAPGTPKTIFGNLSNTAKVLSALGLKETVDV